MKTFNRHNVFFVLQNENFSNFQITSEKNCFSYVGKGLILEEKEPTDQKAQFVGKILFLAVKIWERLNEYLKTINKNGR